MTSNTAATDSQDPAEKKKETARRAFLLCERGLRGYDARWRRQRPILDTDTMSGAFLRHESARTGEVDWRPTETVPQDFLAFF